MRNAEDGVHLIAATVGFLSFFLLWIAAMWGVILRNGWTLTRMRHSTVYSIHQTAALAGLVLGMVHGVAQLAVPEGTIRPLNIVVPFTYEFDRIGVGVGVVALELLLTATLTVLIQRKLGYSRWRALHTVTYSAFLFLAAHVLISGSDTRQSWAWMSVLACCIILALAWSATVLASATGRLRQRLTGTTERPSTVNVEPKRCARFGFCEQAAPDVFKLRADGRLAYRATISDEEVNAVVRAAELCPVSAITLRRAPTSVVFAPPPPTPSETPPTPPPDAPLPEPSPIGERRATVTGMRRPRSPR